jgi:hypothetical protein
MIDKNKLVTRLQNLRADLAHFDTLGELLASAGAPALKERNIGAGYVIDGLLQGIERGAYDADLESLCVKYTEEDLDTEDMDDSDEEPALFGVFCVW